MDVAAAVAACGGAATLAQLRSMGATPTAVNAALRAGLVVRPRRGSLCLPDLPDIGRMAADLGGALSCGAAARAHGLPLLGAVQPHLVVPRNAHVPCKPRLPITRERPDGDVVVHRRDVPTVNRVTTLAQTAVDCARCLPRPAAVAVVDAVLRRGVARTDLLARLSGPGSRAARDVVLAGDGRAESPLETLVRLAFLPVYGGRLAVQVVVPGLGRLDFVIDGWLVVEPDGYAYHSDRKDYRRDRRRQAELARRGLVLLRPTYEDIVFAIDRVLRVVDETLSRGRPPHGQLL